MFVEVRDIFMAKEKRERIETIKTRIDELRKGKEDIERELKRLEEKLKQLQVSELPILIFSIDETPPRAEIEGKNRFEHVYYLPETNQIKSVFSHSMNDLLPNALDFRSFGKDSGVPEKICPGNSDVYVFQVKFVVDNLKSLINELSSFEHIESWDELRDQLTNYLEKQGYVKNI